MPIEDSLQSINWYPTKYQIATFRPFHISSTANVHVVFHLTQLPHVHPAHDYFGMILNKFLQEKDRTSNYLPINFNQDPITKTTAHHTYAPKFRSSPLILIAFR